MDAATADEPRAELSVLDDLVRRARKVRAADADRNWTELRDLLQDDGADGARQKIIIGQGAARPQPESEGVRWNACPAAPVRWRAQGSWSTWPGRMRAVRPVERT